MATFAELCRALAPDAPIPPGLGPDRERQVGWVRVLKPRVPAFDALERDDLAIVPAGALAVVVPDRDGLELLVEALAGAEVAGVLIVGEDPALDPETPHPDDGGALARRAAATSLLRDALDDRGVPVVVRPTGDPTALERSAIAYLVNRRAELERQAGELERTVEALVLAGRGPEPIAAAIASFVARPVVLERRRGEPLAIHVPGDGPAAAVAAYHARPAAVPFRLPLPGQEGRPAGSIVLLGDGPVRERERVALERIAMVLALALGAVPVADVQPPGSREPMPPAGPPWVVLLARQAGEGVADERPETREELRRDVRLIAGPDRLVLRGDAGSLELRAVVAATGDDPAGLALAGRIGAVLGRPVAVSRRFGDPAGRPAAEAEARATLEAVERLPVADRPSVGSAERLPAYRLLGDLPHLPDGARQARLLLEPLLAGSANGRSTNLATLRAVLERGGATEAAQALGVHRNTVAYRIRRIEALGGWDLTDPDLRLALGVAMRIVQSEQI